jgi:hypothetical protein
VCDLPERRHLRRGRDPLTHSVQHKETEVPAPRLVILVLVAAVAACALPLAGRGSGGSGGGATAAATPLPSLPDVIGPSDAATSPRSSPPAALLSGTQQTTPAGGALGSWALAGGGSDSPWLPAASLPEVRSLAGARLVVSFADGTRITFWQALYARADDTTASETTGLGGRDLERPLLDEVIPDALGPGDWVLSVRLGLAGGGSASYYWRLRVS